MRHIRFDPSRFNPPENYARYFSYTAVPDFGGRLYAAYERPTVGAAGAPGAGEAAHDRGAGAVGGPAQGGNPGGAASPRHHGGGWYVAQFIVRLLNGDGTAWKQLSEAAKKLKECLAIFKAKPDAPAGEARPKDKEDHDAGGKGNAGAQGGADHKGEADHGAGHDTGAAAGGGHHAETGAEHGPKANPGNAGSGASAGAGNTPAQPGASASGSSAAGAQAPAQPDVDPAKIAAAQKAQADLLALGKLFAQSLLEKFAKDKNDFNKNEWIEFAGKAGLDKLLPEELSNKISTDVFADPNAKISKDAVAVIIANQFLLLSKDVEEKKPEAQEKLNAAVEKYMDSLLAGKDGLKEEEWSSFAKAIGLDKKLADITKDGKFDKAAAARLVTEHIIK